jgi:hypothetical protein
MLKQIITDEKAQQNLRKVTICRKPSSRIFLSKLIAIEPDYFVFETTSGQVMRNRKENILEMHAVEP